MNRPPTKRSIRVRISEFDKLGRSAFVRRYASGFGARAHYLIFNDRPYDLKALWASAHDPPVWAAGFSTTDAIKGATNLGFTCVTDNFAHVFREGERRYREASYFVRDSGLVEEAKRIHGVACMACGFDFEKFYGPIGRNYIECHHIYPMSRDKERESKITEIAVVCSNCHQMIHREDPHLDIGQVKKLVKRYGSRAFPAKPY